MAKEVIIGVTEFKAKCLKLLDDVARRRTRLIVTKRGRPFVEVVSASDSRTSAYGSMRGTAVIHGDITKPTGERWFAEED